MARGAPRLGKGMGRKGMNTRIQSRTEMERFGKRYEKLKKWGQVFGRNRRALITIADAKGGGMRHPGKIRESKVHLWINSLRGSSLFFNSLRRLNRPKWQRGKTLSNANLKGIRSIGA